MLHGHSCGPKGLLFRKHLKLCPSLDSQEMFPVKRKKCTCFLGSKRPAPLSLLLAFSPFPTSPLPLLLPFLLVSLLSSLPPTSLQFQTLIVLQPEKIKIAHMYKPVDLADSRYFPWGSPARCCPLCSEPVSLPLTQRRWRTGFHRRSKLSLSRHPRPVSTHPSPRDFALPALWSVAGPVVTAVNLPPKIRVLVQSRGG